MHIKIGVSKAPITEAPESRRTFWGTVSISRQALLRFFMFFSLSLLVSRVTIAGQLMPFGAAFIAAAYLNRKSAGWLAVFLGSLASAFVLWKDASLPHIALYAILYALLCLTALVRIKRHLITAVTAALLAYAITIAVFNRGLIYDSLMWVFETGISVVMVFVFNIAFGLKPGSRRLRTVLMDDEIISAAFVCLVVVLGFSDISFLGVYLRNIASVFLALLFAYTGGLAVGAAVGVMLGFGVMLAGGDVAFMANLAMGALVAGLLNKTNRVACAVGFLIINAIMTFFINNSAVVIIPLVDSLAAIGIFLCLPRKFLETAGTFVDANLSRLHAQKISIRRFRELTVGRLHEVAGIFANAAAVFERSERRPSDCTLAVRGVRERVCRDCPIANYCWQNGKAADEEFRRAYCEYGRSGYCELSGAFGKKCMKEHTVNAAMNDVFYMQKMNEKVARQAAASRKVVGEQLMGVSRVISSLGREFEMDIHFLSDAERALKTRLDAAGVRALEVSVEGVGDGVTACLRVRSCGGTGACEGRIKAIVSAVLGRRMEAEKQLCRMGAEACDLKFLPKKKFSVAAHAISVQKHGNAVCGDAAVTVELKDGRFMLLVCDGMGSGERAAERSQAAVVLAKKFYNAGFEDATVIGSINKLLMLSSPDDTYSTMDQCMIDRNAGEAVFTKIGAPGSYVWRGGSILKVGAGALPIGILDDVKPSVRRVDLKDGDMIVMLTDGISDLAVDLAAFVKNCVAFESPENAAGEIIRAAMEVSGGQPADDMTVVVAKVRLVS